MKKILILLFVLVACSYCLDADREKRLGDFLDKVKQKVANKPGPNKEDLDKQLAEGKNKKATLQQMKQLQEERQKKEYERRKELAQFSDESESLKTLEELKNFYGDDASKAVKEMAEYRQQIAKNARLANDDPTTDERLNKIEESLREDRKKRETSRRMREEIM